MCWGGGREVPTVRLPAAVSCLKRILDTVPTGQLDRWRCDPWGARVEAGRVYARGAHDDVAGAVLVCLVARAFQELKLTPRADLYLLLTTEEECSGGGMRALRRRHPELRPEAHLLVDGNSQPQDCIIGHPGCVSFTIRIPGPFGSAQDARYVHDANPIELAGRLITALCRLEEDLAGQAGGDQGSVCWPGPTLAIVGIQSAGWISNVPEQCNLQVWGNVIPPMTIPRYRDAIESCVRGEAQTLPWFAQHPPRIEWGPIEVPAMFTPVDSPFYRALAEAHHRSFGTELRPRLIGGWGDMRLLDSPQMLFYGPGRGGGDHGYDEYYEISDLAPMLRTLLYLVADWCGVS